MAAVLAAGALVCGWAPPAEAQSPPSLTVTVAIVPPGTTVDELARVPGMSPGLLSAGVGEVPPEQTFLDVSQGNRIDETLYDRALLGIFPFARQVPGWEVAVARADSAPADLLPGLLAGELRSAGIPALAEQPMGSAAIVAADERGLVEPFRSAGLAQPGRRVVVLAADPTGLSRLVGQLRGDDLLIAVASPPPGPNRALPIGLAGRGFDGNLTSDSTRTGGYVLSTDLAPAILERFGLSIPDEMDGEPIRAEGAVDPGSVDDLADRMAVIPDRRVPVLVLCLAAWSLLALAVSRVVFGLRRVAVAWLALAFAYMPLMLLVGAWLEPSAAGEGLLVGLGAAALAALTVRRARGWYGLAIACAITVVAYAIDVVAGSGLTRLSLLGPNPIFGVRFYGIGNELEALIAVMVPVGVGAGLSAYTGWGREVSRRGAAAAFLSAAVIAAIVFGAGRFGADVGAAIVLPVGGAVAAASLPRGESFEAFAPNTGANSSKLLGGAVVIAAPVFCLALLALIDLVSAGNAHLSRSVLDAGGAGDLGDVVERRLRLSAHDFAQAAGNPLFWIVAVGIGLAASQWWRIDAWLRPAPQARAGLLGGCAAVAVGVLVNDSGATFLSLGALALGAFLAFAWSQAPGTLGNSRVIGKRLAGK